MQLTKNFGDYEFECSCCGQFFMDMNFLTKLQMARDIAGRPFVITSGCQCPEHNRAIGGKRDSSHLKGLASDIRTQTSSERFAIVNGLVKAGFARIGIGKDFVHVDMDMSKPQELMWTY